MDDQMIDDDTDLETEGSNDSLADLRRAANDGKAAKKELAMLKAGVPTDSPLGEFFMQNYKGELNTDAIKAQAQALGVLEAPAPVQEQGATSDETTDAGQAAFRGALATDSLPPGTAPTGDTIQAAYGEFREAMSKGQTRDEAAGAVIGKIFVGAYQDKDDRFIFDAAKHSEKARPHMGDLL